MIYCKDCCEFFDEEFAHKTDNYVPYGLGDVKESTELECPHCNSNNLLFDVKPVACDKCGVIIPDIYSYRHNDECLCSECYDLGER